MEAALLLISQHIRYPTHILSNSSSRIDLIFMNQTSFITNTGIESSLHTSFHRQIVYANLNLKIEYQLFYERLVWN